jgi:PKD repeat protein
MYDPFGVRSGKLNGCIILLSAVYEKSISFHKNNPKMQSYNRFVFFVLSYLLLSAAVSAQDTISGVINHYAKVLEANACSGTLIVDDASAIQAMDTLLIIQMQGAQINLSNTSNFGTVTDIGSAGQYEPVVVDTVMGDTIQAQYRLLNDYDPAGKVQVVRIPYYDQAVVGSTLQAQAWDGETGGVLALYARTLTLQADIDVSGQGFRGGSAALDYDGNCSWLFDYDEYRYEAGSIRSGGKGEGIAGIPIDWPRGRGPAANGGGAGNDHNAGGGGGAQIVAGGRGGNNNNPSFFGCQGPNHGLAGRALPDLEQRLFLGGGGGAGHGNNDVATDGGNGGGIAIVLADQVEYNGFVIRANGEDAATAGGDGAGGGGAGGVVYVEGFHFGDGLLVEARGGRGGDADNNNAEQCFGPGGGGAGGKIYGAFSNDQTVAVSGGAPGLTFDSAACPDGTNGAEAGEDGATDLSLFYVYSTNPPIEAPVAGFDFAINGLTVDFENLGQAQSYAWSFGDGNTSTEESPSHIYSSSGTYTVTLSAFNPFCGDTVTTSQVITIALPPQAVASFSPAQGCAPLQVQFTNNSSNAESITWLFEGGTPATSSEENPTVIYTEPGSYSVQLRASNGQSTDTLLLVDTINVLAPPQADFQATVNGFSLDIANFSEGDNFNWDFGDGSTSNAFTPAHTYSLPGPYTIQLIVANACGNDTLSQSVTVGSPPIPDISLEGSSAGCAPKTLLLSNATIGFYDSLRWELPGGDPVMSTEEEPTVVYDQPGVYTVRLLVFSPFGTQEVLEEDLVTVYAPPTSAFDYSIDGLTVSFTNLSTQADSYNWNFDDGNTSQAENPVHTYAQAGFYEVTLNASNPNCARSSTQGIFLDPTSSNAAKRQDGLLLFPNPASDQICLLDESKRFTQGQWQLFNVQGQLLREGRLSPNVCWEVGSLAGGWYQIRLRSGERATGLVFFVR